MRHVRAVVTALAVTAGLGAVSGASHSAAAGAATLSPYVSYPTPGAPAGVTVADVTGDGRPDVLVAASSSTTVYLLAGRADGTLAPATMLSVGSGPTVVLVADLNGDGRADLVVLCAQHSSGRSAVDVLLNQGGGHFAAPVSYPTVGQESVGAAVGDVNGDGIPDVVTADTGSAEVSVLLGRADGTLAPAVAYPVGTKPQAVALADTGSGHLDVLTADSGDGTVSVLRGNGNGTFAARTTFPTGSQPLGIAVADVTGDGRQDVVTADYGSQAVDVLAGRGAGTFAAPTAYPLAGAPRAVTVGDVTGDGVDDVVAVDDSAHLDVLAGQRGGGLGPPVSYPVESTPLGVGVGDANDDGRLDALSVSYGKGTVDVLTQDAPAQTTQPVASGPVNGPPASTEPGPSSAAQTGPTVSSTPSAPSTATTAPPTAAATSAAGATESAGPLSGPAGAPPARTGVAGRGSGATGGRTSSAAPPVAEAFAASIAPPSSVTLRQVGRDTLLGLLLIGLLALPVAVVNDTAVSHVDRLTSVADRVRARLRLPGRLAPDWQRLGTAARFGVATVVGAALYTGTQPHIGLNSGTLELALGLGLTTLVVAAASELSRIAWLRRSGACATLRLYPGFGALAVSCLLLTRVTGLQPGLLLGKLATTHSDEPLGSRQRAQSLAVGRAVLAAVSTVTWCVRGTVAAAIGHGFVGTTVDVALTGIVASGIQALLFGLIPLQYLPGHAVLRWSRWAWAGLTLFGAVAFVHIILGQHADGARVRPVGALLLAYLILAAAFWAFFRRRADTSVPAPAPAIETMP